MTKELKDMTDRQLYAALKAASEILETAKRYFPKSIQNADRFSLENVLANSIRPALAQAEGDG